MRAPGLLRPAGRALLGARTAAQRLSPDTVTIIVAAAAVLATMGSIAGAVWHFYPCVNGHPAPDVLWTRSCYSDILPLYGDRGLGDGAWPYLDHDVEYPVLIGAVMALIGLPVHHLNAAGRLLPMVQALGFESVDEGVVYFWGTAALLSVLAVVCTVLLLHLRTRRRRDVLLWALAPVLAAEAFVNWDLVAVVLALAALVAWSRGRPGWAGVLVGLGTAAKIYPAFLLVAFLLACLRAGRRGHRPALAVTGGAAAAWALVNLPVALLTPSGWYYPYRFSAERWIDWGTLWFLLDHLPHGFWGLEAIRPVWATVPALNIASAVVLGVALVAVGMLTLAAPQPPRVAQLAFLVVAVFLLSNKVWSPQFVLWLTPLAVLARPRLLSLLAWQLVEVTYYIDHIRSNLGHHDTYAFIQFGAARWIAVAMLVAAVVADVLRPGGDVVRTADGADPDDGVLAGSEESDATTGPGRRAV